MIQTGRHSVLRATIAIAAAWALVYSKTPEFSGQPQEESRKRSFSETVQRMGERLQFLITGDDPALTRRPAGKESRSAKNIVEMYQAKRGAESGAAAAAKEETIEATDAREAASESEIGK